MVGLLRTSAPATKHVRQVFDVDDAVAVRVSCTRSGAGFCSKAAADGVAFHFYDREAQPVVAAGAKRCCDESYVACEIGLKIARSLVCRV